MHLFVMIVLAVCLCRALPAAVILIPNAAYLDPATYIDISGVPAEAGVSSISGGNFAIGFGSHGGRACAPGLSRRTWSEAPDSQRLADEVLPMLVFDGSGLIFTPSQPVTLFGFEAGPDNFGEYETTAGFYYQHVGVDSSIRMVNGDGGSRLFATDSGPFDSIVFSTTREPLALGAFRDAGAEITPVPPAMSLLLASGLIGLGLPGRWK
ncbi:MAG: hypothetical protein IT160_14165 [Bryobacterales bacterium]|nr:hypothetical protein [Bryobacterales bacterium]